MRFVLFRTPVEAPGLPAETAVPPPELSPPPPPSGPTKRSALLLIALVIGAIVVPLLIRSLIERRAKSTARAAAQLARTATVARGVFVRQLRLTGTVEAVEAYTIAGPQISGSGFGQLVVTRLPTAGAHVKKGDLLAEFDQQSQVQAFLDARAAYQGLADQVATTEAAEVAARAKDDTDLKQAVDNLKQDQLEILKDPILAQVDVEKNRLNLQEAEAKLNQLRSTYALKRQAARAGIRDLQIQAQAKLLAMQHAQQNEKKMVIPSPVDGIVVLESIWKGNGMGQVEVGDQVWNGEPFLQVVSPGAMEVQIQVNQDDLPYLRLGQAAEIYLDAYPQAAFSGTLQKISPIGVPSTFSDSIRTFAAVVSIQQSDPRLMPDLSAAVDVQLQRLQDALTLPRDAVLVQRGRPYVLVKTGASLHKRAVKVGPANDIQIVIESGLNPGDLVERNVTLHK
jgi:HlyD family secretion protein